MSKTGTLKPDPTMIGNVLEPPLVRLPDTVTLFAERAEREGGYKRGVINPFLLGY